MHPCFVLNVYSGSGVTLDDVVGLEDAKQILTEVVLLQNQRPDVRMLVCFVHFWGLGYSLFVTRCRHTLPACFFDRYFWPDIYQ